MDADPRICLSFLYKNDPFYSLCLSDLMTAPQRIQNKFLKEQKNLTMTVKRLEHQKLTRLRQLNEEKKQFSLLMKKRLAPTASVRRGPSLATDRGSQRTYSSVKLSSLASSKSGWNSTGAKSGSKAAADFPSAVTQDLPASRTSKFCQGSPVPGPSQSFSTFGVPGKAKDTSPKGFISHKKGDPRDLSFPSVGPANVPLYPQQEAADQEEKLLASSQSDWLTACPLVEQSAKGISGLKSDGNSVHLALTATITLAGTVIYFTIKPTV